MITTNLINLKSVGEIEKTTYRLQDLKQNQFIIKTALTGLCRNDILAFKGVGWVPPIGRFGHEGCGTIIKLHEEYKGKFKVGDIVSTFDSDPCFGECYYSDDTRAVLVPELSQKYIMEPIACALNIVIRTISMLICLMGEEHDDKNDPKILLIGTGFMSLIIKQYCNYLGIDVEIAGTHHRNYWEQLNVNPKPFRFYIDKHEKFDAIMDLSGHMDYYSHIVNDLTETGAIVCFASTPKNDIKLNFDASAWKDLTYIFPSPRTKSFLDIMELGVKLIKENILSTEFLWSKGYRFDDINACKQGFEDGMNRQDNYLKGYIEF